MRGRAHRISRLGRAAMVVALMGATLLATATPSGDPQSTIHVATPLTHPIGEPAPQPGVPGYQQGAPGFKVQLDDAGRPVVPSAPQPPTAAAVARTQRPPLIEFETPAGGTLLMLDNRFHHHSVAHREADGTLSVDCGRHSATPPAGPPNAAAQHPSAAAHASPVPPVAYGTAAPSAACKPPTRQIAGALP